MASNDDLGTISGVFLGILGAVALAKWLSQKRCPRCGNNNPNTNIFCNFCGERL